MNLIDTLATFSRANCIGICATLVPIMLLSTLSCLGVSYFQRGQFWIKVTYGITLASCVLMGLHVGTWFSIGVITPITFILLGLALTCVSASSLVYRLPLWSLTANFSR
ncbi:MAG: hypothetical protein VKJ27_05910 [Synechocystis sp.]|nr:hypothetical protein [Synechocystis sp.]